MGFRGRWRYILPLVVIAVLGVSLVSAQVKIQKAQIKKVQIKPPIIKANPVLLRQMYFTRNRIPYIKILKTKDVPLIPLEIMQIEAPARTKSFYRTKGIKFITASKKNYPSLIVKDLRLKLAMAVILAKMNHQSQMTPIRYQGDRGTCVAFACMAALEPFPYIPDDLSEQYAYYKLKRGLDPNPSPCRDGLVTWQAADYLKNNSVCQEANWGYNKNKWNYPNKSCIENLTQGPPVPAAATSNARYGISQYQLIFDHGTTGENSIKNVDDLKRIIFDGYNIVIAVHVAGTDWESGSGIIRVQHDANGNPLPSMGGHAMLVCGYNNTDQYFIVKNSWNSDWGHSGYAHISFDYIRQYAKYGFYVITGRAR
jgi:hypothetical protein